ncbi:MAG: hypothetical protein NTZ42_04395 [Candidatus Gribaldobacteria bacterium]|nr:hypothetical protein [Candidatus Gribaldobacteria bacterium]
MDYYDKKYGIDSGLEVVENFHKQRRMFAIKDGVLHIAPENAPYSHAQWFTNEGWIKPGDDELMGSVIRGFVDNRGVFFYKDYDFSFNAKAQAEILSCLRELVDNLRLDLDLHLFAGLIKGGPGKKWPGQSDLGVLRDLLDK